MGDINSQKVPNQVSGQETLTTLKENTSVPGAGRFRNESLFRAEPSELLPKCRAPRAVEGDPKAFADLYQDEAVRVAKRPAIHYEVKLGDTLSKISDVFGVSLKELSRANPLYFSDRDSQNLIRAGDTLKVPATKDSVYKIASGDTFSGIAARHDVPVEVLKKANPIFLGEGQSLNSIKAGQELVIPGGKLKHKGEFALKKE